MILLAVLTTTLALYNREKLLCLVLVAAVVGWMLLQLCQSTVAAAINATFGSRLRYWQNL